MTIARCVQQIIDLSAIRGIDMSFRITTAARKVSSEDEMCDFYGFPPPGPLFELYSVGVFPRSPWEGIFFMDVSLVKGYVSHYNSVLDEISSLIKFPSEVNGPIRFGKDLVPFAAYGDNFYCIDCKPNIENNGFLYQVLNVSTRSGKVKVEAHSLEAFLEKGIKKIKKEMKEEEKAKKEESSIEQQEYTSSLAVPEMPGRSTESIDLKAFGRSLIAGNGRRDSIQVACCKIVEWYLDHADKMVNQNVRFLDRLADCRPGLSEEAIRKYETTLGVVFPDDLRSFLQVNEVLCHEGLNVGAFGLTENISEVCQVINDVLQDGLDTEDDWRLWPGTRMPVMGKALIPVDWDEPVLCYDLNPGPGGVVGQLVSVDIENSTCKVEYPSLLAFLEESIREIEAL